MLDILQACYWYTTDRTTESPSLAGEIGADVAIIGAGFTGLWTAYFLKRLEPALDVVVLEQGIAGYGASGRNAGMVSECIDHSHDLAQIHFGKEEAKRLAHLGLKNIDELAEYAKDCDFERNGQLHVALTDGQLHDCEHAMQVATELGVKGYRMLSCDEVRTELNSPLYKGGLFTPGGGILNPVKLVCKLKRDCQAQGVRFYDKSKVVAIGSNTLRTEKGVVSAEKMILATDAYSHHLRPQLLVMFVPLYDYILVSDPLSASQLDSIGWKNRQGVTDGRTFFNYYRLTADNRILWGTSEAMYYPPNKVDTSCDHSEHHYKALLESFARHFPQLDGLKFPYRWGGPIASTTRLTPFFGTMNGGRLLYGLGYTGHGIGTTRLAGSILAHMALSRDSELLELKMVRRKPFPYPPEPLRRHAIKAVTKSLQDVDAGHNPGLLLKMLDAMGIGFSS
ncbi:MAG TPA: FAD-dependent oxidoreductase [Candidatus Obscuribacterales bacterium]